MDRHETKSDAQSGAQSGASAFDPMQVTRPERSLLKYYIITALLTGPAFPLVFLPLFFKFETLRYRFDAEGVSMSWGLLFRREVYLTYRRIQDIHLTRNLIQRWLGLANVSVQTASGSAMPEMVIEGISQADQLRDFLYGRMRGAEQTDSPRAKSARRTATTDVAANATADVATDVAADATPDLAPDMADESGDDAEVTTLLTEIRDSLRSLAARTRDTHEHRQAGE